MNDAQEEMLLVCRDALLLALNELEKVAVSAVVLQDGSLHAAMLTVRLTAATLTTIPHLLGTAE